MFEFPAWREPLQSRSQEMVHSVFTALFRELESGSFDVGSVNVNRVAERAGISVGSLYQYFPKKESLLSALIAHFMRRRVDDLQSFVEKISRREIASETPLGLEQAVTEIVDYAFDLTQGAFRVERALISWFARVGSMGTLSELDREMIQGFARVIDFLKTQPGRIREVDSMIAARILAQSCRAVLVTTLMQDPGLLDSKTFRSELACLVFSYLKP